MGRDRKGKAVGFRGRAIGLSDNSLAHVDVSEVSSQLSSLQADCAPVKVAATLYTERHCASFSAMSQQLKWPASSDYCG